MWGRVANQDPCRTLASGLCKHKENVGRDILEELVPSCSWSCGCTLMRGVNRACGSQHGVFLNRETSFDWPAVMFCRGMWSSHTLEEVSMFSVWRAVWCHVWVWVQHSFLNVWGKSHFLLLSWATELWDCVFFKALMCWQNNCKTEVYIGRLPPFTFFFF